MPGRNANPYRQLRLYSVAAFLAERMGNLDSSAKKGVLDE